MLKVQIVDDDCIEDEYFGYSFPLGTPWGDIQTLVRLGHPTCTSIFIETVQEVE